MVFVLKRHQLKPTKYLLHIVEQYIHHTQAHSQKSAMGELLRGSWAKTGLHLKLQFFGPNSVEDQKKKERKRSSPELKRFFSPNSVEDQKKVFI